MYGSGIDEVLAMDVDGGAIPGSADGFSAVGNGDARFYYYLDAAGNAIGLANEAGQLAEGYVYTAYGHPKVLLPASGSGGNVKWDGTDATSTTVFPGSTTSMPYSPKGNIWFFTGRQYDPETGSYNYRARQFHPVLGQFMSMDPSGTWGDEHNLGNPYAYVGNNPSTHRDPSGLQTMQQCTAGSGRCSYNERGDIVGRRESVAANGCYQSPLAGGRNGCSNQKETALRSGDLALGSAIGAGEALQATASAVTFGGIPMPSICGGFQTSRYHSAQTGGFGECYGSVLTFGAEAAMAPALLARAPGLLATPAGTRAAVGCGLGTGFYAIANDGQGSAAGYAGSCGGGAVAAGLPGGTTLGSRALFGIRNSLIGGSFDVGATQIGNYFASGRSCSMDLGNAAITLATYGVGGAVNGAATPRFAATPNYGQQIYDGVAGATLGAYGLPMQASQAYGMGATSCAR